MLGSTAVWQARSLCDGDRRFSASHEDPRSLPEVPRDPSDTASNAPADISVFTTSASRQFRSSVETCITWPANHLCEVDFHEL